ncbi:hypothetical protein ACFFX1_10415 [Dactylosporangium sucinum]|uniref:Uncharacterized protein n=1 Tax=Dactylosporangium sucinum TaxID=1424081 RepID=A0A917TI91_9ACTN|nr:hypothetical protein [Dactylosporangium sucinum]GGM23675.1 hypothetical protein GCM10007977_026060 [Dactylosporangium sucinum]
MKGIRGTAMTVHRLPRRPAPQTHPLLCPICFSVKGEPCWAVRDPGDGGTLRRVRVLAKVHPQRLIALDQRAAAMPGLPGAPSNPSSTPKTAARRGMGAAKGKQRRSQT